MTLDRCPRCRSPWTERAHPRRLKTKRDRARCEEARLPVQGTVVWIARFWCDCGWAAQVRQVDTDLLALLAPDPRAAAELRHRAQTGRHAHPAVVAV